MSYFSRTAWIAFRSCLAYSILSTINDGTILELKIRTLSLSLHGRSARNKRLNEVKDSSVIHYRKFQFDVEEYKTRSFWTLSWCWMSIVPYLNLISFVPNSTFLHTDHHIEPCEHTWNISSWNSLVRKHWRHPHTVALKSFGPLGTHWWLL